jgi:PAS domain S-box-containing protein
MYLTSNYIYFSLCSDISPDQINDLVGDQRENCIFIHYDKFFDNDFRQEVVNSSTLWVMDQDCFHFLLDKAEISDIANLPHILVILNGDVASTVMQNEIPENISFLAYPCKPAFFRLQLNQALKLASKNHVRVLEFEKYNSLFSDSAEAQLLLNPQTGKILDANKSAAKLFDKEPDKLIAANLRDIHAEGFEVIQKKLDKVIAGQELLVNLTFLKLNGELIELEYSLNLLMLGAEKLLFVYIEDVTEKKKSYEYYFQQVQVLKNTLESIDDLLFSLNRQGDFLDYYQTSGGTPLTLSADIFVGKNIFEVGFPADVANKYLQAIEKVMDDGKRRQIDYNLEAFGSSLWYNAKISPRRNAFGMIDGVTVLCRDITKQRRTEDTLKVARDFYLTLLSDFPSMIWKTNLSKRTDYFNKTWLEFTGRDLDTELRTDWLEKLHIADVSSFLNVLLEAYMNKEAFQIEHRLKHHSGEYRWVLNAGRPFYNLNGQFAGFIGSCYDISSRRKAEEMMYLQKSAMESALEGILIIEDNHEYPVIYANKELARLTAASEEDILGKSFLDVLGCPLNDDIKGELIKALKEKKSFKGEFFCESRHKDSPPQWHLLYMAPVEDKVDSTNHFVAVLSDITEAKEIEQTLREKNKQLRKTNEELDSFVYSTSHELRSPLSSVLGLINIMETEVELDDHLVYLSMIRESISRLDKIIHDIIDYSRNTRLEVMNERVDFKQIIEKVIQDHKYFENFDKVRFEYKVHEGGPFLSDKKRIQTVLNNFVSNALRFHNYNQSDPFVEIIVKTSPVNAIISIRDNGTGIHEKHMPKIYDMFYRGTEKSKGSGIGLYIVKEIIDKLKGSIHLHTVPQKGCTFTVDLPNYINKNYRIVSLSATDNLIF